MATKLRPNVARTLATKRGGKGRVSPRERRLASATGFRLHYVVPTGERGVFPPYYHIDPANPDLMIAIEVDGPSRRSLVVQAADRRKTRFLRSLGWRVIRVTNADVDTAFDAVLQTIQKEVVLWR